MHKIRVKSFLILMLVLLLLFCSCKGNINGAVVTEVDSEIYTRSEINSAIRTAKTYFMNNFSGCKLLTIKYAGDSYAEEAEEWADTYESDKAIVLLSDFKVDSSGGDGSLNPNSTYTEWKWVLVKDNNGIWKHATHGYG